MYISREKVEAQAMVPPNLPWTGDEANEKFLEWAQDSSREIDSGVGYDFPVLSTGWKFAAYPDTPPEIVMVCGWLVASRALESTGMTARVKDGFPMWVHYRKMAENRLTLIRKKELDVYGAQGQELDTDQPTPITVKARPSAKTASGWDTKYYY